MLSIASNGGPTNEELIREFDHFARNLIPLLIGRFDQEGENATEKAQQDSADRISELESDLDEANKRITDLQEQIARLESDLALIS